MRSIMGMMEWLDMWSDDFHFQIRRSRTGDRHGCTPAVTAPGAVVLRRV
jgi:hypothetical protein